MASCCVSCVIPVSTTTFSIANNPRMICSFPAVHPVIRPYPQLLRNSNSFRGQSTYCLNSQLVHRKGYFSVCSMASAAVASFVHSQDLDSKSECPPLFDGTTRLYYSALCPYAQRVWIAQKYKGLDEIECVPISLSDKPAWYKEKVYPVGKEEDKKQAAAELVKYIDTLGKAGYTALSLKDAAPADIDKSVGPAFDYVENALGKYANEGPFFLGKFGLVDIAYVPFIERLEIAFSGLKNYDVTAGRPNLAKWLKAMDTVDAYNETKLERSVLLDIYKRMLEADYFRKVGIVTDEKKAAATPVATN
ncbi:hypothetical protein BDL97_11G036300 [Sphagnum fallax]|nr:hypothetical protein BDL97_11G036300 [Sphagnum fallax]